MGSNPSTESNYKTAVSSKDKMQMLCMKNGTTAEGYNRRKEPKDSNIAQRNLQRICGHEHAGSLGLNGAGEHDADFTPTGGEDV
ncbi:hypothetical protein F511_39406 [Dorcoceras hygrometricum]|uniref:Uncharacterized protein n=1 Tax=Dorcoceras hygrometricum TaxID=472368 RepID=A0A2Z7CPN6_9LAMI|nr:hypothetical protein F511_39406 [Dorcoceras hygrometricum]